MYYVAKVLGQVFANPPFYVLRCLVSTGDDTTSAVVKGKIAGPMGRGAVFTFKGKKAFDKQGRPAIEVERTPINPKFLTGSSLTQWKDWSDPQAQESVEVFSTLAESGANVAVLNSLWRDISANPKIISENPWFLVQKGLTFKVADNIARRLIGEFDPARKDRVSASILWSIKQANQQGHCYLDFSTVFRDATILTGLTEVKQIAQIVKELKDDGVLVVDKIDGKNALYLPSMHKMETEVASFLTSEERKVYEDSLYEEILDDDIRNMSRFELTDEQVRAVKQGLIEPVSIVTGLPGTGKTTILNTLCKALIDRKEKVLLVAPTGIAAKRVSSLTGLEAKTIHRAFGAGMPSDDKKEKSDYEGIKKEETEANPLSTQAESDRHKEHWRFNPSNPRSESVVIIDEASMVDLHLMWRLLRGISRSCRVVMVGDVAQLPPVGAGFTLQEIIQAQALPRVHLDTIFRQGGGSGVVKAAHKIHAGEIPSEEGDYELADRYTKFDVLDFILERCRELQLDGVDFHVMSPTHHGVLGVTNLNRELRAVLNPNALGHRSVKVGNDEVRIGDRVMFTKNDYELEVFNGDVGVVHHISSSDVEVIIKGAKNQIVSLPIERVGSLLRLAYATTVHKAQGQEYHTILMPMSLDHGANLLQRSLLYTAITRAKEKVYLVGERDAVAVCVSNVSSEGLMCGLHTRF